jgi:hypothetical protein
MSMTPAIELTQLVMAIIVIAVIAPMLRYLDRKRGVERR